MNYTLHQLQVFVRVVENRSITRAAEELFMTQPAVSIQLKNLQDQFEIPLTEVIGRQLYVTDFGIEIYHMAQNILNEVQAINYKTNAYKGMLSGKLKLSIVSTGKYIMPYFLNDFLNAHEGVDLLMDVTNKQKVIESLKENEIDFALVSVLPEGMEVFEEVLLNNELYLIANKDYSIPKKKLTKEELMKLPFIFREEGSATRKVMEAFFSKKEITVRKKLELTSNEAVKQAVIAGLGFSVMPLIGIRSELKNKQLKIIPLAGFPITTKWRLIWLKSKSLSPLAKEFVVYLGANKEKIERKYFKDII